MLATRSPALPPNAGGGRFPCGPGSGALKPSVPELVGSHLRPFPLAVPAAQNALPSHHYLLAVTLQGSFTSLRSRLKCPLPDHTCKEAYVGEKEMFLYPSSFFLLFR